MKHQEFKSGDLVENIHTEKIEMVDRIIKNGFLKIVSDECFFIHECNYKLINSSKIKFNLKKK